MTSSISVDCPNRQVDDPDVLEKTAGVVARLAIGGRYSCSEAHQAAFRRELAPLVDRWNPKVISRGRPLSRAGC